MHSAIVYATLPEDAVESSRRVSGLLAGLHGLEGRPTLRQLGEFVWLANFRDDPSAFAQLVYVLQRQGFAYGILPLADEPRWIMGGQKEANA